LAEEYEDQQVVFVEQDADNHVGVRYSRWWAAYDDGNWADLPFVMVDSGHQINNGWGHYYGVDKSAYRSMVDAALARPAQAEIIAYEQRIDDRLNIHGELTNHSETELSYYDNGATLHAIIYEDSEEGVTGQFVHAAPTSPIHPALDPGQSMTFTLSAELSGVDWGNIHAVALADYRPGGTSYDTLQAAIAQAPSFDVHPKSLVFMVDLNDAADPSILLGFDGPHVLNWTVTEHLDWLDTSSLSGSVWEEVSASVNPARLSPGWQSGSITFTATSAPRLHFTKTMAVTAYYGPLQRLYLPTVNRSLSLGRH
jgi:hypothetical protein